MRSFLLPVVALALAAAPLRAQQDQPNPIEIGIDGALTYRSIPATSPLGSSFNVTTLVIPIQQLRVGFFISPNLSIEPTLSLMTESASCSGCSSSTTYGLGVGALYHFSTDRRQSQLYVRPFASIEGVSGGCSQDCHATTLGAGVGVKLPMVERLATRLEAAYGRTLQSGSIPASNAVAFLFGLSFLTH